MKLNHREYSKEGFPLLILHGLFGSISNWGWQSNAFSRQFAVTALDLRNHGASPHDERMDYAVMAQDVLDFIDEQGYQEIYLLGHSMGGKVAMQLALDHPQRVRRLVIADIAPVSYEGEHDRIFEGLQSIDLRQVRSRNDADRALLHYVDDELVRQFLLTNLVRDSASGTYSWRINLPVLARSYRQLREKPGGAGVYDRPALFIKGALSNYITEAHEPEIQRRFPQARIETIMQAGHWLHAEKPQTFHNIVAGFLGEADQP